MNLHTLIGMAILLLPACASTNYKLCIKSEAEPVSDVFYAFSIERTELRFHLPYLETELDSRGVEVDLFCSTSSWLPTRIYMSFEGNIWREYAFDSGLQGKHLECLCKQINSPISIVEYEDDGEQFEQWTLTLSGKTLVEMQQHRCSQLTSQLER